MQENQANQTETEASAPRNGHDGGASGNEQGTVSTRQQGGAIARSQANEARELRTRGLRELTSGSPFSIVRQLSREMDRLMDSFFDSRVGSRWGNNQSRGEDQEQLSLWSPRIDVRRRSDAILIRADLPGVRREDIQIEVDDQDNALVISGHRREEREEGGADQEYQLVERSYGSFYRSVPLPAGTDVEQVKAEMRDGVLNVTLPLAPNARRRRIQIES